MKFDGYSMTDHAPGFAGAYLPDLAYRTSANILDLAYRTSAKDSSKARRRLHIIRSVASFTVVHEASDLFPDVARYRVQSMNLEPLQCLGRSPAVAFVQAHSAIVVKPVFWNVREKLQRLFGILELDTQMLQQCKLRVVGGEQECTGRMHFSAKIERVKWKDLRIKGAIKVQYLEAVVSHLQRDHVPFIISFDVSEVSNGTTAGSKQVSILRLAVQVPHSQGYDPPLLFVKGCQSCVDTRFNVSTPRTRASDFALKGLYHIAPLLESCCWVTY